MADSTTVYKTPGTGSPSSPSFEFITTRASAGGGDIIIIPSGLRRGVSVVLKVTSGSGKVQFSCTPRQTINDTPASATWIDWSNGVIAATGQNQFGPISALRINNVSGSQTLEIQGD